MMLGASSLSSSLATDSIPRESQRTATHLGTGIWYQGPSGDKWPPGHTHKCVNTFNREPPIVPLLFVLERFGNYLHWFCTRFPTVDLLTIVDPIVLYRYRSTVWIPIQMQPFVKVQPALLSHPISRVWPLPPTNLVYFEKYSRGIKCTYDTKPMLPPSLKAFRKL